MYSLDFFHLVAAILLLNVGAVTLFGIYQRRLGRRDGFQLARTFPDMKVVDLAAIHDRNGSSGSYLQGLLEGWRDAQ